MKRMIPPGGTIGVLGGGQLGRMFAIAARRMGYRVHVLSPEDDTPAGQVADVEIAAAYDDFDATREFARSVDAVTFEFENVPMYAIEQVAQEAPVYPSGHVLHTTQNRLREKAFLRDLGIPVTPFHAIGSEDDLRRALPQMSHAAVLKTASWGYDGKGQQRVATDSDPTELWLRAKTTEAILEEFVDFERELSVVAARGSDGQFVSYDPIVNDHTNHILDVSISPVHLPDGIAAEAAEMARRILEQLDVVGVLCVEFFLTRDGHLLVNELAPRPHNSGHLTIDAHTTCQFEQQVRAVCGLPLGSTAQHSPAAMVNLLGDLWEHGPLDWYQALTQPDVKLHLYGKEQPRPGRKMGHLTALADSTDQAMSKGLSARKMLIRR